jgi:hypothetical protein
MHRAPIHTAEKAEKLTLRPGPRPRSDQNAPRRVDSLNTQQQRRKDRAQLETVSNAEIQL